VQQAFPISNTILSANNNKKNNNNNNNYDSNNNRPNETTRIKDKHQMHSQPFCPSRPTSSFLNNWKGAQDLLHAKRMAPMHHREISEQALYPEINLVRYYSENNYSSNNSSTTIAYKNVNYSPSPKASPRRENMKHLPSPREGIARIVEEYRHLIFAPDVDYSTIKRHLKIAHQGLKYGLSVKETSDAFVEKRAVDISSHRNILDSQPIEFQFTLSLLL
jgi:hypothetical protein